MNEPHPKIEITNNLMTFNTGTTPAFVAEAGKILIQEGARIIFGQGSVLQVGKEMTKIIRTEFKGKNVP